MSQQRHTYMKHTTKSTEEDFVNNLKYHFGIIDYLQKWDLQKKSEQCLKMIKTPQGKNEVSAVPPKKY